MGKEVQVVVGGTSGMGLALAMALKDLGVVLIGGRSPKKLENALEQLKAAGAEAYGKTVDISDEQSMKEYAAWAASFGHLDNVINAAGVDAGGGHLITTINYKGTVNFVEAFYPLVEQSRVVNFSSVTGYFYQPTPEDLAIWNDPNAQDFAQKIEAMLDERDIIPSMAHMGRDYVYYISSKRFVMYYTQANTKRFGAKNSQIFSVAPGAFDTPMLRESSDEDVNAFVANTAFKRPGTPEEMAAFICGLLSKEHPYLTGVDLILDGGMTAMAMIPQIEG